MRPSVGADINFGEDFSTTRIGDEKTDDGRVFLDQITDYHENVLGYEVRLINGSNGILEYARYTKKAPALLKFRALQLKPDPEDQIPAASIDISHHPLYGRF